ncbi:MAG TPA: hypothetical protein VKA60_21625 [Blastocatellia bacterium]|nr:hypothetical protein [Blastocatellia bacterium]
MVVELNTTTPAGLRAVFSFGRSRQVRVELDIGFTGGDRSEDHLAEIARIIDGSRHNQRLDPDCSDCDWHQVLTLIRRCHDLARVASRNLITSIRIEDGEGATREVQSNFMSAGSAAALARAI